MAQIIISREDSTSFFSIGTIRDDASLVSALGGALTNFAIEMGLSDSSTTDANYSKFQNGLLISKWLEIGNHRSFLMIAIRGFENLEEYHRLFLIEYGSLLANKIITSFEKIYSSEGEVPPFADAAKLLPAVANELLKSSPDTLKEFVKEMDNFSMNLLDDMWKKQRNKGLHPFPFRATPYGPAKVQKITEEFIKYFYQKGAATDALFPLGFASAPNLSLATKMVESFLKERAQRSRDEIAHEIKRIIDQLQKMSSSRSRRGEQEVESVELINAAVLFEQISMAKTDELEKERTRILNKLYTTLLQKLFQNYPLKFLASSTIEPLDITFIRKIFEKTAPPMLDKALSASKRISKQISLILREVVSDFTPDTVIKKKEEIIDKVEYQFIKVIKKENPFVILVDPKLTKLRKIVSKHAKEALERYQTAHDEATALWYITRQIHNSISKSKRASRLIPNLMQLHFLQAIIRQYQFRYIPEIVYGLAQRILAGGVGASTSKESIISLIEKSAKLLEREAGFSIPHKTKKTFLQCLLAADTSKQSFENIEELSFFSRAFTSALESTIIRIIQSIFGSENQPSPPELLTESVKKIVLTSQSIYSFILIIQSIVNQPGARKLFNKETLSFIKRNFGYKAFLPSPVELARVAYETGWFKAKKSSSSTSRPSSLSDSKKSEKRSGAQASSKRASSKISDAKLLVTKVTIPEFNISGKISELIKDPVIVTELWVRFGERALMNRYRALKNFSRNLEKKAKIVAGDATGKKRYASEIKQIKTILKSFNQLISGGGLVQKIFTRRKSLGELIFDVSRETFNGLNYYPESLRMDPKEGVIFGSKIEIEIDPMIGTYQRLIEVYASTWVLNSEYIRKLKEDLLWRILDKSSSKNFPLEKKIIENLQHEAARGRRGDQEEVVRTTIEQEVSLIFNKAVRESIAKAFGSIKEELLVRVDEKTKEFFIRIGYIDLPKRHLQPICDKVSYIKFVKTSDKRTEIQLKIFELLPMLSLRKKQKQPVRLFLRQALMNNLRSRTFKAIAVLGEMTEQYIGEQAADLFFSHSRIFEELISESVDQS